MSVGWSPTGAANEGQPQDAVSRMGVGPPHTIEEVTEGDEVMEKRGRQDGITTEQAKGRTQRWQPLLPNLRRVNEATRPSGQTRLVKETYSMTIGSGLKQSLSDLVAPYPVYLAGYCTKKACSS